MAGTCQEYSFIFGSCEPLRLGIRVLIWDLGLGFRPLKLGFKVRVRLCPITIANLLFANLEMGGGGKMAGAKCLLFP